jgi:RNA polymerase sporulation-specific sigma factor
MTLNGQLEDSDIVNNMPLVIKLASSFYKTNKKNCGAIDLDDLISAGYKGLLIAKKRYKSSYKTKFSTYATHIVRHEIQDEMVENGYTLRIPQGSAWKSGKKYSERIKSAKRVSLLADHHKKVEVVDPIYFDEKEKLLNAVNQLPPMQKVVLEYKFGLNGLAELTNKEIAALRGVSRQCVSIQYVKGMAKLKLLMGV